MKVSNPNDVSDKVVFTLNQVNSRFVDETMNGTYEYAQISVVVARIEQSE